MDAPTVFASSHDDGHGPPILSPAPTSDDARAYWSMSSWRHWGICYIFIYFGVRERIEEGYSTPTLSLRFSSAGLRIILEENVINDVPFLYKFWIQKALGCFGN